MDDISAAVVGLQRRVYSNIGVGPTGAAKDTVHFQFRIWSNAGDVVFVRTRANNPRHMSSVIMTICDRIRIWLGRAIRGRVVQVSNKIRTTDNLEARAEPLSQGWVQIVYSTIQNSYFDTFPGDVFGVQLVHAGHDMGREYGIDVSLRVRLGVLAFFKLRLHRIARPLVHGLSPHIRSGVVGVHWVHSPYFWHGLEGGPEGIVVRGTSHRSDNERGPGKDFTGKLQPFLNFDRGQAARRGFIDLPLNRRSGLRTR